MQFYSSFRNIYPWYSVSPKNTQLGSIISFNWVLGGIRPSPYIDWLINMQNLIALADIKIFVKNTLRISLKYLLRINNIF